MYAYKYCVAQVNMVGNVPEVSFYAFSNDGYGLHRVDDINDRNVLWYNTERKAKEHRLNSNDCVVSKLFE